MPGRVQDTCRSPRGLRRGLGGARRLRPTRGRLLDDARAQLLALTGQERQLPDSSPARRLLLFLGDLLDITQDGRSGRGWSLYRSNLQLLAGPMAYIIALPFGQALAGAAPRPAPGAAVEPWRSYHDALAALLHATTPGEHAAASELLAAARAEHRLTDSGQIGLVDLLAVCASRSPGADTSIGRVERLIDAFGVDIAIGAGVDLDDRAVFCAALRIGAEAIWRLLRA